MRQRIEVARASAPLTLNEGTFPAGTYVVRLDQPYRNYAVDLLTAQHYPKDAGEAVRRRLLGTAGALPPRRRSRPRTPACAASR